MGYRKVSYTEQMWYICKFWAKDKLRKVLRAGLIGKRVKTMENYTTVSGDTWDKIARTAYGDELKADRIMKDPENAALLDYEILPAGTTVHIPEIPDTSADDEYLPEWRK